MRLPRELLPSDRGVSVCYGNRPAIENNSNSWATLKDYERNKETLSVVGQTRFECVFFWRSLSLEFHAPDGLSLHLLCRYGLISVKDFAIEKGEFRDDDLDLCLRGFDDFSMGLEFLRGFRRVWKVSNGSIGRTMVKLNFGHFFATWSLLVTFWWKNHLLSFFFRKRTQNFRI